MIFIIFQLAAHHQHSISQGSFHPDDKIPSKYVIPGFKTFSISVFYLLPSIIIIIIIIINLSIIITLLSTIISSIILGRLLVFHNDILKLNNISKYNFA